MSLFGRALARLLPVAQNTIPKYACNLGIFDICKSVNRSFSQFSSVSKLYKSTQICSCGCNGRFVHTKGERELAEFLQQEIAAEKKNLAQGVPAKLDDFHIKADRAQLVFSRKFNEEEIMVTLDVNHTVDADDPHMAAEGQEVELKSKPSFEVDVKVGSRVLSFTCSYMTPGELAEGQGQDVVEDVFGINEVTIYDGEWSEDTYCVSGDILDEQLYDLLMNYLEERGISEEFAEKMSNVCSGYEHSQYVGLLEKLQDFVRKK